MHPALRMPDAEMIRQHLRFISTGDSCVVAFKISGNANNDPSRFIVVILNAQNKEVSVNVGAGRWNVIAQKGVVNLDDNNIIEGNIVNVAPLSALIITQ
jgi:pullulanase